MSKENHSFDFNIGKDFKLIQWKMKRRDTSGKVFYSGSGMSKLDNSTLK